MEEKVLMTPTGKKKLEQELERLMKQERPAVIKAIEEARAHGDLKENSEYKYAKERQGFIEGRIQEINHTLATAEVINPKTIKAEHIVFGATVKVQNLDSNEEITYQIVGKDEADPNDGKISVSSPIAKALIGKHVGAIVDVKVPKGDVSFEVLQIKYL